MATTDDYYANYARETIEMNVEYCGLNAAFHRAKKGVHEDTVSLSWQVSCQICGNWRDSLVANHVVRNYYVLTKIFLAIFQSLQWLELTLLPNQLFVCLHMPAYYDVRCIVKNAWIILHIFAVKWKSPFGKYLGWFMLMINRLTMWTQNIWYKKT